MSFRSSGVFLFGILIRNKNYLKAVLRTIEFVVGFVIFGWSPAVILFGFYVEFCLDGIFEIVSVAISSADHKADIVSRVIFFRGMALFLYTIFLVIIDVILSQTQGFACQIALRLRANYGTPAFIPGFIKQLLSISLAMIVNYLIVLGINYKDLKSMTDFPEDSLLSKTTYHLHFALTLGFLVCIIYFVSHNNSLLKAWPYVLIGLTFLIEMKFANSEEKNRYNEPAALI